MILLVHKATGEKTLASPQEAARLTEHGSHRMATAEEQEAHTRGHLKESRLVEKKEKK